MKIFATIDTNKANISHKTYHRNNSSEMSQKQGVSTSEPLDLIRLRLDEKIFVKLRGNREMTGKLHVSVHNQNRYVQKVKIHIAFMKVARYT